MGSFMWQMGEFFRLPREDGITHDTPLSPNHHRVSIDYVMDDYRGYNLPYAMDGSQFLVDLIGVPLSSLRI
jgi:hypothetical protein